MLNFLCSDYRRWLTQNPSQIVMRCHNGYKLATAQYRDRELEHALRGIGRAFEMSEIMLKSDSFCSSYSSNWLVATSVLLVRVLSEMGRVEDSINIHIKTDLLLTEAGDEVETKRLLSKLERIARDAYGSKSFLTVVN